MPNKRKPNIFDDMVSHHILLERVKKGERKNILSTVQVIDEDVRSILLRLPKNYTKRQLDKSLDQIEEIISAYYSKTVLTTLESNAADIVSMEVDHAVEILRIYLAEETPKTVSKHFISKKVNSETYQGKKLQTWTRMLGKQKTKDITSTIRNKSVEGASVDELASSVRFSAQRSNNAATKVSDAYINKSVNTAKEGVYNQNPEWVEEIIWSSILDGKTTLTCAVRSEKRYDANTHEPIGHSHEWNGGPGLIHWGCRSIEIPARKDGTFLQNGEFVSVYSGDKTAIGAKKDYERGDNLTKDGKLAKIPNANNKLEIQVVKGKIDYETWMRRQPRAFVDDVLGVKKAAQFIDGKQSLDAFVVESGRELTIKELNKKLK